MTKESQQILLSHWCTPYQRSGMYWMESIERLLKGTSLVKCYCSNYPEEEIWSFQLKNGKYVGAHMTEVCHIVLTCWEGCLVSDIITYMSNVSERHVIRVCMLDTWVQPLAVQLYEHLSVRTGACQQDEEQNLIEESTYSKKRHMRIAYSCGQCYTTSILAWWDDNQTIAGGRWHGRVLSFPSASYFRCWHCSSSQLLQHISHSLQQGQGLVTIPTFQVITVDLQHLVGSVWNEVEGRTVHFGLFLKLGIALLHQGAGQLPFPSRLLFCVFG